MKHRSNTVYIVLKNLGALSQNTFCVFFEHLLQWSYYHMRISGVFLICLPPMVADKYWIIEKKNGRPMRRIKLFLNFSLFQASLIKF